MCVLLLTVGVSVGVVGSSATEVERGGGRATLVVSGCVMIEEEEEGEVEGEVEGEGEGEVVEGEGVVEGRTSDGEGVDVMRLGVSTTVEFSMPELSLKKSPELFMNIVIFSVSSTEGVGDTVGVNDCVGVGLGTGVESLTFWARMTGHRTRRRRRGEGKESSSDRTIFNLQWEKGGECDISKEGGREGGREVGR